MKLKSCLRVPLGLDGTDICVGGNTKTEDHAGCTKKQQVQYLVNVFLNSSFIGHLWKDFKEVVHLLDQHQGMQ